MKRLQGVLRSCSRFRESFEGAYASRMDNCIIYSMLVKIENVVFIHQTVQNLLTL